MTMKRRPSSLAHVVDRDDVGMAQAGAGLGFAEEAGAELVGDLDVGGDHLEGDGAIEDRVMGLEDRAHATASEPLDDVVLPDRLRLTRQGVENVRPPRLQSVRLSPGHDR